MNVSKIKERLADNPIVQGGMGISVSMSSLASSVSKLGGLGTLSGVQAGFREPNFLKNPVEANCKVIAEEIAKAKEKTKEMLAMNLMTGMKNYDEYVKAAVKSKIDVIVSGAGMPMKLPTMVKGSDTMIVPIISSVKALQFIVRNWLKQNRLPDAVVLEGPLAGGHLGFKFDELIEGKNDSLETLVVDVKAELEKIEHEHNVQIPLIAGGGIHTREDVERIMNLGAEGVQIGTKFIATKECDAHEDFKTTFVNAQEEDIKLIKSPTGLPARAIRNAFLDKAYDTGYEIKNCFICMHMCNPKNIPYCISKSLFDSVDGNPEGLVFSGANGYKINKISTVEEVMKELLGK